MITDTVILLISHGSVDITWFSLNLNTPISLEKDHESLATHLATLDAVGGVQQLVRLVAVGRPKVCSIHGLTIAAAAAAADTAPVSSRHNPRQQGRTPPPQQGPALSSLLQPLP
jgi:hypothetical protein